MVTAACTNPSCLLFDVEYEFPVAMFPDELAFCGGCQSELAVSGPVLIRTDEPPPNMIFTFREGS